MQHASTSEGRWHAVRNAVPAGHSAAAPGRRSIAPAACRAPEVLALHGHVLSSILR